MKNLTKWCLSSIAAISLSSQAFAFVDGPKIEEISIRSIQANGSGCPPGSTTKLTLDTDGSGSADFFQLTFSQFFVERPGIIKKNCIVEVVLGVPQGWTFTIGDIEYEGYADVDQRHIGVMDTAYQFPFFSNRVRSSLKLNGPYADDYVKEDKIGISSLVFSPCGRTVPLNINTSIMLRQKPGTNGGYSFMDVERQSGLFTEVFRLQWRRC